MARHATEIRDWNVVVTVHGDNFLRACRLLSQFGDVGRTGYYNVVVLRVPDIRGFLDRLARLAETVPDILEVVARVLPAQVTFEFRDVEDFERQAREAALEWLPHLAGKAFYVRLHRRGLKGRLSTPVEERFLDEALLESLETRGEPGHVSFEDPDAVIDIETVGTRAGMSLWSREDLDRYPFLRVD